MAKCDRDVPVIEPGDEVDAGANLALHRLERDTRLRIPRQQEKRPGDYSSPQVLSFDTALYPGNAIALCAKFQLQPFRSPGAFKNNLSTRVKLRKNKNSRGSRSDTSPSSSASPYLVAGFQREKTAAKWGTRRAFRAPPVILGTSPSGGEPEHPPISGKAVRGWVTRFRDRALRRRWEEPFIRTNSTKAVDICYYGCAIEVAGRPSIYTRSGSPDEIEGKNSRWSPAPPSRRSEGWQLHNRKRFHINTRSDKTEGVTPRWLLAPPPRLGGWQCFWSLSCDFKMEKFGLWGATENILQQHDRYVRPAISQPSRIISDSDAYAGI
ncbi:hypothetical protein DFH09DRAFT_1086399 [Mycena vulgaris]|nr:hypothetical protein DFH09DRAFT_1086399 [Mycena vulgaris]